MIHSDANVNNVCLTLISTGELYRKHCELANNDNPADMFMMLARWKDHVSANEHLALNGRKLQPVKLGIAAAVLRQYYLDHIAEG